MQIVMVGELQLRNDEDSEKNGTRLFQVSGVPKERSRVPLKKFHLPKKLKEPLFLDTAQQHKRPTRTFLWDIGTFGTPDTWLAFKHFYGISCHSRLTCPR